MDEHEQIIIAIIFGIVGIISIIIIICFTIWLMFRRKSTLKNHYNRQQYQRSQNLSITKFDNIKRKRRRKFNTNESAISLSFNPPHLINQNVKNLDKLLVSESSLSANSGHHKDILPTTNSFNRCYINASTEPIYISSSISKSIPNPAITLPSQNQKLNNIQFRLLNELNYIQHLKQEQKPIHSLKYSQSCRQTNDQLPFDYYRSITPSIISSNETSLQPIYTQTMKCSNVTLMRKARLAQLRDDTAILY